MAATLGNSAFTVSNVLSGASIRQVDTEFDILPGIEFPLLNKIGSGSPVMFNDAWKHEWIVDQLLKYQTTIAEDLDNSETGVDVASGTGAAFQVGQVFQVDDEQMRVTSISTDTLTVTRGYAGTTAATHSNGATAFMLLPSYLDTDSFTQGTTEFGEFVFNYPKYTNMKLNNSLMRTIQSNYLSRGQSEIDFQMQKQMIHRMRLLERDVIYGVKQQPSGSNPGGFDGLMAFITTNKSDSLTTRLQFSNIVDDVNAIFDYNPSMNLTIAMNRRAKRIFNAVVREWYEFEAEPMTNEFGVTVDRVRLDIGTFDVMICDSLVENDEILYLQTPDIQVLPAKHELGSGWIEFTRGIEVLGSATQEKGWFWMGTLKVGNEKKHARRTGFSTTTTDYPAYI